MSNRPRFKAPFFARSHRGKGNLWDVVDAQGKTVVSKESYGFASRFVEVGPGIGEVEEVREAAEAAPRRRLRKKKNTATATRSTAKGYEAFCPACQHVIKLRPGFPYYRQPCPKCGGKIVVQKAENPRGALPPIRWEEKPPPRAWQDAHYRAAVARRDIKDPIAFVKWTWQRRMSSRARAAARKNPFVSDDQIRRAYKFYKAFMRRPADRRIFVDIPKPPRVSVLLGEVSQISYTTRRDGDTEAIEYYHRFKHPRPRLCTDQDGKKLFLAGGGYKVTKDGITG
jgi:predicted RNA-binding Zn-ribbon protein involved in translation (DUF1610 family)